VFEGTNRNMPANTLVQLLALYTNPESQNMHSVTDRQTDRHTEDRFTPIADHTV